MSITTPDTDDVADLVDLCVDLDGASTFAEVLVRQMVEVEASGRLAHRMHGMTPAEATVFAGLADLLRDER